MFVQIKFVNIKRYLSRSKVCGSGFLMQYRHRLSRCRGFPQTRLITEKFSEKITPFNPGFNRATQNSELTQVDWNSPVIQVIQFWLLHYSVIQFSNETVTPPPPTPLPFPRPIKPVKKTRDLGWVRKFRIALQFQDFLWYCLTFPYKHLYHCETRLEWDTNKGTPLKSRVAVRLHSLRTHICKIEIMTLWSQRCFSLTKKTIFLKLISPK